MGKHSATPRRRKRSFWRRYRRWILGTAALVLIGGITAACILLIADPYKKVLNNIGIEPDDYHKQKQTVTVTFTGDAEGVLLCREALNAWRAAEDHPKTVHWIIQGGTAPVKGTVEELDYIPTPSSPRVETLEEEITLVKLNFELGQSDVSANVQFRPTLGADGKTVTIQVETRQEDLHRSITPILAAVNAVNEEGGGIIRCDIEFRENGTLFAAASYDFLYGDEILSSLFTKEGR